VSDTRLILDAIHERSIPLKDHTVGTNQTTGEAIRRNRLGV
jgi:2-oxoisovalerate dehydrogenase E1 component